MTMPRPEIAAPAGEHALFLDIDGTLLEHQPHPEGVSVNDGLRQMLRSAVVAYRGAVAFVTGRSLEMVDRLFSPLRLPAAGLYGLEHRRTADGPIEVSSAEPEALTAVADALERRFRTTQGIYFERKGPVLAVHTRAAPASLPEVRAAAEDALARLPDGYRILAGHAGLEFLPLDALKSAAIERFMGEEPFRARKVVFIGDDVSDEAGFDYVNSIDGISIRVRPNGPTAARFVLPDVAAVHDWIGRSLSPSA